MKSENININEIGATATIQFNLTGIRQYKLRLSCVIFLVKLINIIAPKGITVNYQ